MLARGSVNLASQKSQAMRCARMGTHILHLESFSEFTFILRACNGDAAAGVVERALTWESDDLDSAPVGSLVSYCE